MSKMTLCTETQGQNRPHKTTK